MTASEKSNIRTLRVFGIIVLSIGVLTLLFGALPQIIRYQQNISRAVAVTATVINSDSRHYYGTVYNSGAGDDINPQTYVHTFYYYTVTYTYQGVNYQSSTKKYLGSIGEQADILIDPEHPDTIVSDDVNGMGTLKIAAILLSLSIVWFGSAWILKVRATRKRRKRN